jgi:hypothetical protein
MSQVANFDPSNLLLVGIISGFGIGAILWYGIPKFTKLPKERVGGLSAAIGSLIGLSTMGKAFGSFNRPLDYLVTLALVIWAYFGASNAVKTRLEKENKKNNK